jgi:hypothetical protein
MGTRMDRGYRGRDRFEPDERDVRAEYDDRYRERYETVQRAYGGGHGGGGHRGKGPQGYVRSDERIREDVNQALTDDDEVDASSIEVEVKEGEVTLSGLVPERRMKRVAEDCIDRISGIKDVHNHIRVQERADVGRTNTNAMRAESVSNSPEKDTDNGKRRNPTA